MRADKHGNDAAADFRVGRIARQAALQCCQRQQSGREDHDGDHDLKQAEATIPTTFDMEIFMGASSSVRALVRPRARKRRVNKSRLLMTVPSTVVSWITAEVPFDFI